MNNTSQLFASTTVCFTMDAVVWITLAIACIGTTLAVVFIIFPQARKRYVNTAYSREQLLPYKMIFSVLIATYFYSIWTVLDECRLFLWFPLVLNSFTIICLGIIAKGVMQKSCHEDRYFTP